MKSSTSFAIDWAEHARSTRENGESLVSRWFGDGWSAGLKPFRPDCLRLVLSDCSIPVVVGGGSNQLQLGPLVRLGEQVAFQDAGEPTLGAER